MYADPRLVYASAEGSRAMLCFHASIAPCGPAGVSCSLCLTQLERATRAPLVHSLNWYSTTPRLNHAPLVGIALMLSSYAPLARGRSPSSSALVPSSSSDCAWISFGSVAATGCGPEAYPGVSSYLQTTK